MKKYLFISIILLCANILFAQVNSPWKWSHPKPQGNTLRYIKVISPSTWYALGSSSTFMKTTNGGLNWYITHEAMGENAIFHNDIFSGWFFDMNTGLACGVYRFYGKLSRTTDGGASWDSISLGINTPYRGMHFINNSTGFMVTGSERILKTTNGGLNWTLISTGQSHPFFNVFALDEDHIYIPSTDNFLVLTTNGGTSWQTVLTGGGTNGIRDAFFMNKDTGWVCGSHALIRKTTSGGANWTDVGFGLPQNHSLEQIIFDSDTLYVCGNELYIFRSADYGNTWDSIYIKGNQYYSFTYWSLDKNGPAMVTAGFDGLINSSTNSGANWVAHNYLGHASTLYDIWCDNMNGKVIAVGVASPAPVLISTNGGTNWQFDVASDIDSNFWTGLSMISSNTGYACGYNNKIYKTVNGGANWDTSTVAGASTAFYCLDFVNENTGFVAGQDSRCYKTVNGGNSWSLLNTGTPVPETNSIDMVDANTGWFVGYRATCRKTVNGGNTWTTQNLGIATTIILNVIQMLDANTGYIGGNSGTLLKTTNGGTNWVTFTNPFTGSILGFLSISFLNNNTGFVAASSGYIIRTSDGGNTWAIDNTSGGFMNSIFAKGYDSAWVCGTGANIFKLYGPLTGIINWKNEVPDKFTLSQNYPNPFNPSTTIKFGLPKAGKVSFKIYDITGREVESVFNNVELSPGTVTYVFDGKNYASGVYFYSLFVNDERINTRKMVLVR